MRFCSEISAASFVRNKAGQGERDWDDMDGIINLYKDAGFTSFDAVAKLRGILHEKKIGHTGTLDPDAEGVLPICIGAATKLCGFLADKDKEYEAVLQLGVETDTMDASGKVIRSSPGVLSSVTEDMAEHAISGFIGDYDQVPPMYSAIKVGGKKLCDLARAGVTVDREPRRVHIFNIEIMDIGLPFVKMRVHCSKGTYIRSLCADIGERLGTGGIMKSLVRTRSGRFRIEDSASLAEIEARQRAGTLSGLLIPVDEMFADYPARTALPSAQKKLENGNRLEEGDLEPAEGAQMFRAYGADGLFYAVYAAEGGGYRCVKMFARTGGCG